MVCDLGRRARKGGGNIDKQMGKDIEDTDAGNARARAHMHASFRT